jgi:hypothetical protein
VGTFFGAITPSAHDSRRPNIALSATSPNGPLPDLHLHTPYIPPHPQKGTKCHRYTLLMLPQPSAVELISIPAISNEQRLGFNVREFMSQCGLDRTVGGGAHMWREVWSEEVSRIYKRIFSECSSLHLEQGAHHCFSRDDRTEVWQDAEGRSIRGSQEHPAVSLVFCPVDMIHVHKLDVFGWFQVLR